MASNAINKQQTNEKIKAGPNFDAGADKDGKCSHKVIMKDMCCICGKNLRPEGGFSGERIEPTVANVSMIHHVPELVVSKEIAEELGTRDHENILRQKKLILLLDLDQTLVHTANRPPRPEEIGASEMVAYRLGCCTFYTKIRPHCHKFLERLNNLYEMHIVTFGQRMYAHKIAEILDPKKKFFDYRILSRDELLSSMHKTGNLKALFPCSEQLILMLDDRPDVWMHSDALIKIRPYRFFTEVGDINAPPQDFLDSPTKAAIPPSPISETNDKQDASEHLSKELESKERNKSELTASKNESDADKTEEMEVTKNEKEAECKTKDVISERKRIAEQALTEPISPLVDDDNALEHIERVLSEVHSLFYQQYERDKKIPDVKRIVSWLRSQVLSGEHIVFSGIIPLGVDVRACELYRMCTQFGGQVDEQIIEQKTTVLVAARAATEKFRHARHLRIPVVNTRWLDTCFERWRRVDKRDFLFREKDDEKHYPANKVMLEQQRKRKSDEGGFDDDEPEPLKRHRLSSASLCLDDKMDRFAQMDSLSMKTMHEMEDEVDSALSDEGDDDDGNEHDQSSSSSANYSDAGVEQEFGKELDDEFPSTSGSTYHENINKTNEDEFEIGEEPESSFQDNGEESEGSLEFIDYGDEDSTRDTDFNGAEDSLFDEMADDLEEQLQSSRGTSESDLVAEANLSANKIIRKR